jgi:transcriptional regulator with XRE-family HTH domain
MSITTRGSQLRSLRERAGLTQAELAARAGLTTSVLSAYENDRREPRVDVFFRLVELAGFDVRFEAAPELDPSWYFVPDVEDKASILLRVCEIGMAIPHRKRGHLLFPPFRYLAGER